MNQNKQERKIRQLKNHVGKDLYRLSYRAGIVIEKHRLLSIEEKPLLPNLIFKMGIPMYAAFGTGKYYTYVTDSRGIFITLEEVKAAAEEEYQSFLKKLEKLKEKEREMK